MRLTIAIILLLISLGEAYSLELLWTYETRGEVGSPTLADVDGDGMLDIIVISTDGFAYVLRGNGTLMWSFMYKLRGRRPINPGIFSSPVAVDLIDDGFSEVVIPSIEGLLYVLDKEGDVIWKYKVLRATNRIAEIETTPVIADVNGDGNLDVVFAASDGNVYALDGESGMELWHSDLRQYFKKLWFFKSELRHGINIISSPAMGDINGDGLLEIVIAPRSMGNLRSKIFALRAYDGGLIWSYELEGFETDSTPSLADLNGDGKIEVIIGSGESLDEGGDKNLYVLSGEDGTLVWKYQAGGGLDSSPIITDVDSDGSSEIIIGSLADGSVYALKGDGSLLWKFRTRDQVYSTAAIADVDGDYKLEVIVGSTDHNLYILDGKTGKLKEKFRAGGRIYSSPAVADIDGDEYLEIVFGAGYDIYVLRAGKGEHEWRKFKYDLWNSGLMGGLKQEIIQPPLVPKKHTRFERFLVYVYQKLFDLSNLLAYIKHRVL
jgi:outer membrane protein assembly factor BamB